MVMALVAPMASNCSHGICWQILAALPKAGGIADEVPRFNCQQLQLLNDRARGRIRSCAHSVEGVPDDAVDGDHSDNDIAHDRDVVVYRTAFRRSIFLRHTATAISAGAAMAAISCQPQAASAVDPQRDRNTASPPPPALLLPVQRLRIAATRVAALLPDPSKWEEALTMLRSPPLSEQDFRTTLDRYSDSNWEKHMLGDLYRNQGLDSIKALKEMIAFSLEEQAKGVDISQDDIQDVGGEGRALLASLDNFVSLAPPADVKMIEELVNDSSQQPPKRYNLF